MDGVVSDLEYRALIEYIATRAWYRDTPRCARARCTRVCAFGNFIYVPSLFHRIVLFVDEQQPVCTGVTEIVSPYSKHTSRLKRVALKT